MKALAEGVVKEVKLIPYTGVTVLAVVGVLTFYVLPGMRRAEAAVTAVANLRDSVGSMRIEMLKMRITTLDSRLTDLELERARAERLAQPLSPVVSEALRRTSTERALAEQELGALLARGQDAAEK
jgi:hypothetical protein